MKEAIEKVTKLAEHLEDALTEAIQICGNESGGMESLSKEFAGGRLFELYTDLTSKEPGFKARFSSTIFFDENWRRLSKDERKKLQKELVYSRDVQ